MTCPFLTGKYPRKKYGRKWCRVQEPQKDFRVTMKREWCMTQDQHFKCPWYYEGRGDTDKATKLFTYYQKLNGVT